MLRLSVWQRRVGNVEPRNAGAASPEGLHKQPCREGGLGKVQVWGRAPSQAQEAVLGMSQLLGTSFLLPASPLTTRCLNCYLLRRPIDPAGTLRPGPGAPPGSATKPQLSQTQPALGCSWPPHIERLLPTCSRVANSEAETQSPLPPREELSPKERKQGEHSDI